MPSEPFTKDLSADGGTAHLYYERNAGKLDLQCIYCHLDAGQVPGLPTSLRGTQNEFTESGLAGGFQVLTQHK